MLLCVRQFYFDVGMTKVSVIYFLIHGIYDGC